MNKPIRKKEVLKYIDSVERNMIKIKTDIETDDIITPTHTAMLDLMQSILDNVKQYVKQETNKR